ncbi:hypothetical protein XELAEV_18020531mg [Xenopus laevis]|uniref:Uncharacterized protein n=1 Tax=Xenopus laevis TaxID=8355 RepID=A0A974D9V4_XENLA|nr:hypothetical protein XELAEV_18020531mg [Xenopus laevis]
MCPFMSQWFYELLAYSVGLKVKSCLGISFFSGLQDDPSSLWDKYVDLHAGICPFSEKWVSLELCYTSSTRVNTNYNIIYPPRKIAQHFFRSKITFINKTYFPLSQSRIK